MADQAVSRYGVHEQTISESAIERAVEAIRLLGYAVVDGGHTQEQLHQFSVAFDQVLAETHARHGGRETLENIDEHNTTRAPLALDRLFLDLALNSTVNRIAKALIGEYVVLNQQNGIVNPPNAQRYNQAAYHRDLPYQHFVSSRPLAINALFCIDPFTKENGATYVIPASHKSEAFPSDALVRDSQVQIDAPAGAFIVLDAMLFHSGGVNRTSARRRAVNHLYSTPFIRQQIDLPSLLGADFTQDPDIRRFLGYDVRTPPDITSFYAMRRKKQ